MTARLTAGWAIAGCLLVSPMAEAHVASNGFLMLQVHGQRLQGSLELAVRDVELAVGVDGNHDGKVTWSELRAAGPRLMQYIGQHLALNVPAGACALAPEALRVRQRVDGAYAWVSFTAHCPGAVEQLRVQYRLLDEFDPSHRGLLTLDSGTAVQTGVLGGSSPARSFAVDAPARSRAFIEYLQAGIWHIWSGIDHLLFLLSLLLPAVLLRRQGTWEPVTRAQPALFSILKVVTAFTLAHSITLSLAAFDVVRLPSRLTELVIAGSIIVAALNNVVPLVTESRARIAFAFGLLHGFGFASVLADMGLPQGARLIALLSFNLGIELGQLAVVLAIMPVAFLLRHAALYRRAVMPWGSAAIAALALVWLVQRALL
jgi:hypothetical protein